MSPEDDICPWCGAGDKRHCDLRDEMGSCPWEDIEETPGSAAEIVMRHLQAALKAAVPAGLYLKIRVEAAEPKP